MKSSACLHYMSVYDGNPAMIGPASPTYYTRAPPRAASFPLAGCFAEIFCATTHAAEAIAHEMKNAVHGSRVFGAATIAGAQTRIVNTPIMAASVIAATSGKTENSTPSPAAICPAPVRYAQPSR